MASTLGVGVVRGEVDLGAVDSTILFSSENTEEPMLYLFTRCILTRVDTGR